MKPDISGFIRSPHDYCDQDHDEIRPNSDDVRDHGKRAQGCHKLERLGRKEPSCHEGNHEKKRKVENN